MRHRGALIAENVGAHDFAHDRRIVGFGVAGQRQAVIHDFHFAAAICRDGERAALAIGKEVVPQPLHTTAREWVLLRERSIGRERHAKKVPAVALRLHRD